MKVRLLSLDKEIHIEGSRTVKKLAKELNLSLESHIFLRNGELLTPDEILREEDEVEIISAISGG